jgi:REP element-mobilizing transposase RayT
LVNSLKGVSSRYLKTNFPELEKYYLGNALWSPSYFAGSCGGAHGYYQRIYSFSEHTKLKKFNAIYSPPEGRGFTALRIKNVKRFKY